MHNGIVVLHCTVSTATYLIQATTQHDVRDNQLQNHLHTGELLAGSQKRSAHRVVNYSSLLPLLLPTIIRSAISNQRLAVVDMRNALRRLHHHVRRDFIGHLEKAQFQALRHGFVGIALH